MAKLVVVAVVLFLQLSSAFGLFFDPEIHYFENVISPKGLPSALQVSAQWTVPPAPQSDLTYFLAYHISSLGENIETGAVRAALKYTLTTSQWTVECQQTTWASRETSPNPFSVVSSSSSVQVYTGDRIQGIITVAVDGTSVTTTINVNGIFAVNRIHAPLVPSLWWDDSAGENGLVVGYSMTSVPSSCTTLPPSGNILFYNIAVNQPYTPGLRTYDTGASCGSVSTAVSSIPSAHFKWNVSSVDGDITGNPYLSTNLGGTNMAVANTSSSNMCAQLCDSTLGCVGWTFTKPGCASANLCYLKSALGTPASNPPVQNSCFISNVKLGEADTARSSGTVLQSITDTSFKTAAWCSSQCENVNECRSWNFDRASSGSSSCSLLSNTPTATTTAGKTSGFRSLVPNTNYYITSLASGKALANDYSTVNNAADPSHPRTYVATITAPRAQSQWTLVSVDATRSTYRLQSATNPSMCLDANWNVVPFGGKNTPWMNTCSTSVTTQRWQLVAQPFSQDLTKKFLYSIVAADYGLCLSANTAIVDPQRDPSNPSPLLWNCTQDVLAYMQWSVTIPHYGLTA